MSKTLLFALAGTGLTTIAAASPAFAQTAPRQQPQTAAAPAAQQPARDEEEIIITGTQIRGIAPVGSNVVTQSKEEIRATGVNDANQLLAQIPSSSYFNTLPEPGNGAIGAGTQRVPVAKPNLRSIPVGNAGSGALTLALMNNGRLVPVGIEQSVVDVSVIPTGIVERVETIFDGASAIYGSDAVAGVINYLTRQRYDGVEVGARYGFADDYWQFNTHVTAGHSWGSGGIALSYEFAKNSDLFNGDRAYKAPINWVNPLDPVTGVAVNAHTVNPVTGIISTPHVDDLTCDVANVQNNGQTNTFHVAGAGLAANPIFCAANEFDSISSASKRHSAFLAVQQDITDSIKFDVTGFYSFRGVVQSEGPFRQTAQVTPANPFYRCTPALTVTCSLTPPAGQSATQRVNFSYGPALGNKIAFDDVTTKLWQITPRVTADLGGDWQLRVQGGYGESKLSVERNKLETTWAASCLTVAGCANPATGPGISAAINPYDIASTDPTLLQRLQWLDVSVGEHEFTTARAVADGSLFHLPGGNVRVALGAEWSKTKFTKTTTNQALPHELRSPTSASQTVKSLFGEIVVPVFGEDNAGPGHHSLILSASARWDDYQRVGDSFNPKLAATYQPVDWITLRANWGTSFRAPGASDVVNAQAALARCIGAQAGCTANIQNIPFDIIAPETGQPYPCYLTSPGVCTAPNPNNRVYITVTGTSPDIKPESSTSWSVGADVAPPFIPGLTLSGTYWHIDFDDIINLPQTSGSLADLFHFLPELAIVCRVSYSLPNLCAPGQPKNAAVNALLAQAQGSQDVINLINANSYDLIYVNDTRMRNLGGAKVRGIDANVSYRSDTSFGSIDARVTATWIMKADLQFAKTTEFVDTLAFDNTVFRMVASLGANIGGFRAQATVRHQDGFIPRPASQGGQARDLSQVHIPGFTVTDLAFTYNFNGDDMFTKDLQLTLNINNVFNVHPPVARTTGGGTASPAPGQQPPTATLGPLIQIGFSKKF